MFPQSCFKSPSDYLDHYTWDISRSSRAGIASAVFRSSARDLPRALHLLLRGTLQQQWTAQVVLHIWCSLTPRLRLCLVDSSGDELVIHALPAQLKWPSLSDGTVGQLITPTHYSHEYLLGCDLSLGTFQCHIAEIKQHILALAQEISTPRLTLTTCRARYNFNFLTFQRLATNLFSLAAPTNLSATSCSVDLVQS